MITEPRATTGVRQAAKELVRLRLLALLDIGILERRQAHDGDRLAELAASAHETRELAAEAMRVADAQDLAMSAREVEWRAAARPIELRHEGGAPRPPPGHGAGGLAHGAAVAGVYARPANGADPDDEERGVYLLIDLTIDEVELAEPNDVKRLSVAVAHGADREAVARLLAQSGAGRFVDGDDEHVWVSRGWLRERAEGRVHGRWSEDLDHMVTNAREHGWIDEDGTHLRAHVEWLAVEDGVN